MAWRITIAGGAPRTRPRRLPRTPRVARRTVRSPGLPCYAAACLLAGYLWLAVAGTIRLAAGRPSNSGLYDAALHAVFLGFVMSMVFGHAPVILPAVLRVRLPYHPVLYAPLVLLHASLLVRNAFGGRFAHVVTWYLWAGTALVTGGTLGGLMASGRVSEWHEPMRAAYAQVNILGWGGLAVLGTLFTLWPTVLRTRVVDGTGRIARWSLRLAVPGLGFAVGGLLAADAEIQAARRRRDRGKR
ncbi:hypothetical protein [Actinomadura sp. B10D3]|uniref:hypothetical protein n=1 Tax=Actinomadura sp. B10D3 TaxID=3153557 RepID=UPI00325E7928